MRKLMWVVLGLLVASGFTQAGPIEFDSKLSVAVRDVTPKDFESANPDSRIVEATMRVSANFSVPESTVDNLVYRFELPDGTELSDYLPKTLTRQDSVGPIELSKQTTTSDNLMVTFEGGARVGYHFPIASGEIGGSAGRQSGHLNDVRSGVEMKLLPPMQLVVAAGTEARGKIVCFKLKPFTQITLEGEKEFACLLVVPKDWTGDTLKLTCRAYGKSADGKSSTKGVEQIIGIGLYRGVANKSRIENGARTIGSTWSEDTVFGQKPALAVAAAPAVPVAPTIVGKWVNDRSSKNVLEMFEDGTSIDTALLKTSRGRYTLNGSDKGHWAIQGVLWGTNEVDFTYSIVGDHLRITMNGIDLDYTRLASNSLTVPTN